MIERETLTEEEASELQRLVEAARFFERPTVASAPRAGAADYRQYTISVDNGGRQRTIRLSDPVEDPTLQQLLRFLQAKARALWRGGGS